MHKEKIVWLCHFANDEVAQIIGINNQPMLAPWISEMINLFRIHDDVDLSIVSPNYYTNKDQDFFIDNIHIYLFKYKPALLPKIAYNLTINYRISRKSIRNIIDYIKPDIIHLFGSENPHYSSAFLDLYQHYPFLVSLQGFVHKSPRPTNIVSQIIRINRIRFEKRVNQKARYFSYTSNDVLADIYNINPSAHNFQSNFPTTIPTVKSNDFIDKKYDLVFYGRVSKNKGVEDFVRAVQALKDRKEKIKAIIIGGSSLNYFQHLNQLVRSFGLEDNIELAGFQTTQQDVFKLAVQADIYVLPSYFDGTPGTIREAMYMRLPVVAYNVGGIPSFNEEEECITLAEYRNISDLVEKIWLVMTNKERTTRLINNAYKYAKLKLDNNIVYENFKNIYSKIIELENEKN